MYNEYIRGIRLFEFLSPEQSKTRVFRSLNEVSVVADLGGAVRFFLSFSHLCVSFAGRVSAEQVWPWRMGCDRTGNHRFSHQYQYGARLSALYAQRD